jgi:hypothetical protein
LLYNINNITENDNNKIKTKDYLDNNIRDYISHKYVINYHKNKKKIKLFIKRKVILQVRAQ